MLEFWLFINSIFWNITFNQFNLGLGLNVVFGLIFSFYFLIFYGFKFHKNNYYSIIILIIFLYFAVALFGPCEDKHLKSLLSIPIFLFLTSIAIQVGARSTNSDWLKLENISIFILICLCIGILIEFFNPSIFPNTEVYRISGKYSGFNSEPSVVACTIFPYVLILLTSKKLNYKQLGVLFYLFFLFFSRSSTLLIFSFITLIFLVNRGNLNIKFLLYFSLLILLIFIVFDFKDMLNIENNETYDRIIGVFDYKNSENLSSLAYIQGWQFAYRNFTDTYGIGLGLNMMGCQPLPEVGAREVIYKLYSFETNTENGTFLFSKIISEFGLVGLLFYIYLIYYFIKIIRNKNIIIKDYNTQIIFIFTFLTSSFIRSPGGYFTADLFILIPALVSIHSCKLVKYVKK